LAPTEGFDWVEELELEEFNNDVETTEKKMVEMSPLMVDRKKESKQMSF